MKYMKLIQTRLQLLRDFVRKPNKMQEPSDTDSSFKIMIDQESYRTQKQHLSARQKSRNARARHLLSSEVTPAVPTRNPNSLAFMNRDRVVPPRPQLYNQPRFQPTRPLASNYHAPPASNLLDSLRRPAPRMPPRWTMPSNSKSSSRTTNGSGSSSNSNSFSRSRSRRRHKHRRQRQHRTSWRPRRERRRDKYGITDESGSSAWDEDSDSSEDELNALQKKIVYRTLQEYLPESVQHVAYEDVISRMEQMDKQGYKLPKGYDARKHNLAENEIKLYEQQFMRNKSRDQKKMAHILNFSALGLSWFCKFINVDFIKTSKLPEIMRVSLEEGEWDECLDGIGSHLRGTVADNPVFSTALKFFEKIGEAHHIETEEEQDRLEEEEDRKAVKHAQHLRNLNMMRNSGGNGPKPFANVPPPPQPAHAVQVPSAPNTKGKKTFKPVAQSKMPGNLGSMFSQLQAPLQQLTSMMNVDEQADQEDMTAAAQFHQLKA